MYKKLLILVSCASVSFLWCQEKGSCIITIDPSAHFINELPLLLEKDNIGIDGHIRIADILSKNSVGMNDFKNVAAAVTALHKNYPYTEIPADIELPYHERMALQLLGSAQKRLDNMYDNDKSAYRLHSLHMLEVFTSILYNHKKNVESTIKCYDRALVPLECASIGLIIRSSLGMPCQPIGLGTVLLGLGIYAEIRGDLCNQLKKMYSSDPSLLAKLTSLGVVNEELLYKQIELIKSDNDHISSYYRTLCDSYAKKND